MSNTFTHNSFQQLQQTSLGNQTLPDTVNAKTVKARSPSKDIIRLLEEYLGKYLGIKVTSASQYRCKYNTLGQWKQRAMPVVISEGFIKEEYRFTRKRGWYEIFDQFLPTICKDFTCLCSKQSSLMGDKNI